MMLSEVDIEKIKSVVSQRKEISYAILFGSALERLLAHSDIDLLIGGNLDRKIRSDLSMALALQIHRPIDIVLTKEARCDVVLKAFSSGAPLVVHDKGKMKEDYFEHYRLCDQARSLRKIRLERLKRVYGNG